MTETPRLVLHRPTVALRDGFLEGLREFQREGLAWYADVSIDAVAADFAAFVREKLANGESQRPGIVPQTDFWATAGATFVGRIAIRHGLNESLARIGGHIGYDVRLSCRRRGYATAMLRESLPHARAIGLERVLVTCDDTNAASARVIEKNGGVLERCEPPYPGYPPKRYYWIVTDLEERRD